jgi:hypothetical protein
MTDSVTATATATATVDATTAAPAAAPSVDHKDHADQDSNRSLKSIGEEAEGRQLAGMINHY